MTERVRRQGPEGSVGRTTKGDTEQHSRCTTTWSSGRASELVCVCRLSQPQGRAVQDKAAPQELRLWDRAVRQARACHENVATEWSGPSGLADERLRRHLWAKEVIQRNSLVSVFFFWYVSWWYGRGICGVFQACFGMWDCLRRWC